MRSVTSTRARPSFASGMISYPAMRSDPGSQVGLAPMKAMAWAMSSPPVRMFDVPQTERASERSGVP